MAADGGSPLLPKRSNRWQTLPLLLVMPAAALFLLGETDPSEILRRTAAIPPSGLAGCLLLYILYQYVLTLRTAGLVYSSKPPLAPLFGVTSLHMMSVNLLPARSGELTYIYFMEKRFGCTKSEGVATLMAARLMDVMGLVLFLVLSAPVIYPSASLWLAGVVLLPLLALALFGMGPFFSRVAALAGAPGDSAGRARRFVARKAETLSLSAAAMAGKGVYGRTFLYTCAAWGLKYLILFGILRFLGIDTGFWKAVFAGTAMYLAAALPVQSVAGIGAIESGLAGGLLLAGTAKETAVSAAFSFHLVLLFYTVTVGLAGWMLVGRRTD